MAKLVSCKDCGHQISKNADKCPNCGKNKRTSTITWFAAIFIGIAVLWAVFSGASDNTSESQPQSVEVQKEPSPYESMESFEFIRMILMNILGLKLSLKCW